MRCTSLLALVCALSLAASAQEDARELPFDEQLEIVRSAVGELGGSPANLRARLEELALIRPLGLVLVEDELPPAAAQAAKEALLAQEPEALRLYAREIAGEPAASDGIRRLALELLGAIGRPKDLELCAAVASAAEGQKGVPRARRLAFERALEEILRRAPEGRWLLADLLPRLDGCLVAPALRRLAAERSGETLALLAGLLGEVEGADGLLLAELARLGGELGRPAEESVAARVRARLGDADRHVAVLAVQAAAALQDTEAIGELIALLEHADPALRAAAEAALVRLARKHYRGGAEAWERWYQGELAWWADEAPRVLAELQSRDPARASAALRELAQHRLHREESAEAVAGILWRPETDLVVVACSILGHLGSARGVPELLLALEKDDPRAVAAAAAALRAITGLDLPADGGAWSAALGPESLSRPR